MNKNRLVDTIKEHLAAAILIGIVAIIYIINMFKNGPWYDELYTYYYFISRGPIYAAIHWPVPNNHVGYSVLSAFLDFFGNPYVGLRGISVICGITNLSLIYYLCSKFMNKYYAISAMALYAGSYLPFRLSFQGRGYTLAACCLLISACAIYKISLGDCRLRFNVIFATALTLGLYTVPSSIYWVIPVCISGGLFLLLKKRYRDLFRLIASGIAAAIATFFLYLLIWLAIGANLLSKNSESAYYGLSQVKIILKAPFSAAGTGIDYMLASPYIQSIDRLECIKKLPEYFISLLGNFYANTGVLLLVLTVLILVLNVVIAVRSCKNGGNAFLSLFACCGLLVVPVMLIIQSVHPYLRVLSFYAIFLFVGLLNAMSETSTWLNKKSVSCGLGVLMFIMSIAVCLSNSLGGYYNDPLAERENDINKALSQMEDVSQIDTIFYTDDFQKYVLKFYYDVNPQEVYVMEDANFVITGPEFWDNTNASPEWPILYGYSDGFTNYVNSNMTKIAGSENYSVYKKTTEP